MNILVQVLLTFLALSAYLGAVVTPRKHMLQTNMLKESIELLDRARKMEVSCNKMNVTNIFADDKDFSKPLMKANPSQRGNNMEILCKAATIVQEGQSCYRHLQGVYDNLLSLVQWRRAGHKEPCPVVTGSTTSLKNFLNELQQVLQEEFKNRE